MDEHEVLTLIETEHKKASELCGERYLPSRTAIKAVWVAVVFALGLVCTTAGWAITSAGTQSKQATTLEQHTKQINDLQAMNSKMDQILAGIKELKNGK